MNTIYLLHRFESSQPTSKKKSWLFIRMNPAITPRWSIRLSRLRQTTIKRRTTSPRKLQDGTTFQIMRHQLQPRPRRQRQMLIKNQNLTMESGFTAQFPCQLFVGWSGVILTNSLMKSLDITKDPTKFHTIHKPQATTHSQKSQNIKNKKSLPLFYLFLYYNIIMM